MTYLAWPVEQLDAVRADAEGRVLDALDRTGDLGARVRAGRRAERIRMIPETLHRVRVPSGPGWVLAGDAGLVMDPVTGQGIGNALRDAELVAQAAVDGLGGRRPLPEAMADYRRRRDDETLAMYEFTKGLAGLEAPPVEARMLFSALGRRQDEIDRFLGVLTGSEPMREYFSPRNLRHVVGLRGMAWVALGRITSRAPQAA